jgi:hypothetical protein
MTSKNKTCAKPVQSDRICAWKKLNENVAWRITNNEKSILDIN